MSSKSKPSYKNVSRKGSTKRVPATKADAALVIAKKVQKQYRPETKWVNNQINSSTIASGALSVFDLSITTKGTDGGSTAGRIGTDIQPKSLQLRLDVLPNQAAGTGHHSIRVLVLQMKNGQTPSHTGINSIFSLAPQFTQAPMNLDTRSHFSVKYDKVFSFKKGTATDAGGSYLKKVIPFSQKVLYKQGTAATYEKGGIFLCCVSNQPTNYGIVQGTARLSYTDA